MVSKYIRSFVLAVVGTLAIAGAAQPCDVTLSGLIDQNAFSKVKETLRGSRRSKTVCFANSPGGSIKSAIEIWDELSSYEPGVRTLLLPNSTCISACAVAFMGGQIPIGRGVRTPAREMDRSSKLGFHRPYVPLEKITQEGLAIFVKLSADISRRLSGARSYISEQVPVTTKIGNTNFAVGANGYIADASTGFYDNFYRSFPAALLREMYTRGPNEFYYIDNKYIAFKHGIVMTDAKAQQRKSVSNVEINEVCRLFDVAFSYYPKWAPSKFETIYRDGHFFYKLPAKDLNSSDCWVLPRDDLAGYQVVTKFTWEGDASVDVEQFRTIKASNLNLVPYSAVNRSQGPKVGAGRCTKYLVDGVCMSRKELIVQIQKILKTKDCYNGALDGIFGTGTKQGLGVLEIGFRKRPLQNVFRELKSSSYYCVAAPSNAASDDGCGWFLITSCSRKHIGVTRRDAQCGANRIVDTSGSQFSNFRNGFFCAVRGPLAKGRALQMQRSANRQGCPSAYVKRNC